MNRTTFDDVLEFEAATEVDLITASGRRYNQGCAMLQALGAGVLAIKTVASDGVTRPLAVTTGSEVEVRGTLIDAATTVRVRVFWRA